MMRMRYALAATAIAVFTICAAGRFAGAQVQCARPNVPATMLYAAMPQPPALAIQQGISGVVQVIISLDAQSRVVGTRIESSPSAILNAAALAAARQSRFQTEIRDCRPIAADYIFSVDFENGTPRVMRNAEGVASVAVGGQGVVSRAPDVAFVDAIVASDGDDAAAAATTNGAKITALLTRLRALGIDVAQIRNSVPSGAFLPPGARAVAARSLSIRVDNLRDVPKVVDAVATAGSGAAVRDVQYGLTDRAHAYEEALANAIKDARARAEAIAAREHLRVASIDRVVVDQRSQPPVTLGRPAAADARPDPVEVRAAAMVTFLLKP